MKVLFFCIIFSGLMIASCTKTGRVKSDTEEYGIEEIEYSSDPLPEYEQNEILKLPSKFSTVSALKAYMNESEDSAKYSEGLIGKIAEYSLDYADRLLHNQYSRFIIVDKSRMKVILFDKFGREEKTYGMACAKNYGSKHKKADSRTPEGFFAAEGIYDSTDWLFTDDDGVTSPKKGQFGPRFIRLKGGAYTSQIGIHGTVAPWSSGGRVSHGCIRLTNDNILELVELVEVGMPIIVVPGRKDMIVNIEEGYDIPWIPTTFTSKEPKIPKEIDKKDPEDNEAATTDSLYSQESEVPDSLDVKNDSDNLMNKDVESENKQTSVSVSEASGE